jgi:hypothetical protein
MTEDSAAAVVEQPTVEATVEAPTATAEPVATETPKVEFKLPGEPPKPERTLEDVTSFLFASEKRVTSGDNFLDGLYERPFTSEEMVFQPDLDIQKVDFAVADEFFFFTIHLYAMNNQGGGLQGMYSVEFDRTLTGRGDLLVAVKGPQKDWSTDGVAVYEDDNRDVGGPHPVVADSGFSGSGYDTVIEMSGDKVAWARVDPADGNAVQIAVSNALIGDAEGFAWGAWADNGLMDPAKFDYNDTMGPTAAGSPIKDKYYPVKALFNLDNTCRLTYGTITADYVPGLCKIGAPPPESGKVSCHCVGGKLPNSTSQLECVQRGGGQWVCN